MRLRIALALAVLTSLALLCLALALSVFFNAKEEQFINHLLEQQLDYSIDIWRKSPDAAFPHTPAMWLYRVGNGEAGGQLPPTFAGLGPGMHEVHLGSREYHVAVREADGARYILAYDAEGHETRLDDLLLLTAALAVVLGLFALYAGHLIAGRLSRRLERLAERLDADDQEALAETGMDHEVHAIAAALDDYRHRQQATLERERAFAANLSHELRTPLTGIRTDAELLAELPGLPDAITRRSARIIASVDQINRLGNSLLMLAREATPAERSELGLRDTLETVWESVLAARPKGVALRNEVPAELALNADPALLDLVLRNILDNALRHSDSGEIVARCAGSCLHIIDTGPGFNADEQEQVFDRFFIGRRGDNGIGLALVRHVCTACGWRVTAGNTASGGEIVIDFAGALSDREN
jgi:signal transduction histidine kinase